VVEWQPVDGALYYNVIRGQLENLRDAGAAIDLGPVSCLEAASPHTSTRGREDARTPGLDQAFFYVAEYHDGWSRSYGTEEAAKPYRAGQGVTGQGACQ
jgi:hypothetical protein